MAIQSQSISPTITQAVGRSGLTVNGGTSSDTGFFLSGSAAPGTYLLVSDGENDISVTQASRVGTWGSAVQAGPGQHFYTIRHLNKSRSPQWVITVDPHALKHYTSPGAAATYWEDFETGVPGLIPEGSTREFPSLSVTAIEGDISVYLADPPPSTEVSGNCIRFSPISWTGSLRFTFNEAASDVQFNIYQEGGGFDEPQAWNAYDEQGRRIAYGNLHHRWQTIHGYGQKIKSIVLSGGRGLEFMLFDRFFIYTHECECE